MKFRTSEGVSVMSEKNKLIARQLMEALWNDMNFDFVDALVPEDYDGHSSTEFHGPDGAKEFVRHFRVAFPDLNFTVLDQIAEGNQVATRWMMSGTHRDAFQGMPPTGKSMTMHGITIFRIVDGQVLDGWTSEDRLGAFIQLGIIPEPGF